MQDAENGGREAGDRRQEIGDRIQKTGDGKQKMEEWRQHAGDRMHDAKAGFRNLLIY
jgi:hypothetical protein